MKMDYWEQAIKQGKKSIGGKPSAIDARSAVVGVQYARAGVVQGPRGHSRR